MTTIRSGCGIIERPQKDAVNDREDGGAGADPERESQDGDGGEAWILDQLAKRITKVGEHLVSLGEFYCCAVSFSAETISIEPALLRRTSLVPPPLIVPLSESLVGAESRDRQIAADAAGAGLGVDR